MIITVIAVCAVSSGGLALTYAVTKDRIAEQEKAAINKALAEVVPGGQEFAPMGDDVLADAQATAGETVVYDVYEAHDAAGEPIGYGMRVGPRGYGGPIRMVVGMDRDGKVSGVIIVANNETPGLGTKAVGLDDDALEWRSQFIGATSSEAVGEMDTITGATKSSRGVRTGVQAAVAIFESVLAEGVQQ